tara:strand:- start:1981 stop:2499 length:519 start_codon:yes stop_codon:yes gene_type:complete
MKTCGTCKELKTVVLFSKRKASRDGLENTCKACARVKAKSWREDNKAKTLAYREEHRDERLAYTRAWKRANPDKVEAIARNYSQKHPDKVNAKSAKRRAAKLQRTPSWACFESIKEFYTCAKDLEKLTGIEFHVDHIVPLQGKRVSGLHVVDNLQILTALENQSKNNSFEVG